MYDVKMSNRRRPRSAARSEHFDLGAEPRSAGKRCIPCEERTSDRLGQRHVPGIVGGHILAELPHAGQELLGGDPFAGPCPVGWPTRVQIVMDVAEVAPLSDSCSAVVGDFDGNGLPDAVMTATISEDSAFVLVLDGQDPRVVTDESQKLADRIRDFPDGELTFTYPGFAIGFDEKFTLYYRFESDGLHEEQGSGC